MTMTPLYRNGKARVTTTDRHGRARAYWQVRIMVNGRRHMPRFPTEAEADEYIAATRRAGRGLPAARPHTIAAVLSAHRARFARHVASGRRSPETLRDYEELSAALLRHLDSAASPQLTDRAVDEYVDRRTADGAGDLRIRRELAHLRRAVKRTLGPRALAWQLPDYLDPEADRPPRLIPSDDEIGRLWHALDRDDIRLAILLGLLTAVRDTDLYRACPAWRVEPGILAVPMSKLRNRVNPLPVVPTLAAALDQADTSNTSNTCDTPYIPCSRSAVKLVLQRRTGCRLPEPDPETDRLTAPRPGYARVWNGLGHLRHIAATWASQSAFPDDQIALVLGHKGATLARRHYIHDPNLPLKLQILTAIETRLLKITTP